MENQAHTEKNLSNERNRAPVRFLFAFDHDQTFMIEVENGFKKTIIRNIDLAIILFWCKANHIPYLIITARGPKELMNFENESPDITLEASVQWLRQYGIDIPDNHIITFYDPVYESVKGKAQPCYYAEVHKENEREAIKKRGSGEDTFTSKMNEQKKGYEIKYKDYNSINQHKQQQLKFALKLYPNSEVLFVDDHAGLNQTLKEQKRKVEVLKQNTQPLSHDEIKFLENYEHLSHVDSVYFDTNTYQKSYKDAGLDYINSKLSLKEQAMLLVQKHFNLISYAEPFKLFVKLLYLHRHTTSLDTIKRNVLKNLTNQFLERLQKKVTHLNDNPVIDRNLQKFFTKHLDKELRSKSELAESEEKLITTPAITPKPVAKTFSFWSIFGSPFESSLPSLSTDDVETLSSQSKPTKLTPPSPQEQRERENKKDFNNTLKIFIGNGYAITEIFFQDSEKNKKVIIKTNDVHGVWFRVLMNKLASVLEKEFKNDFIINQPENAPPHAEINLVATDDHYKIENQLLSLFIDEPYNIPLPKEEEASNRNYTPYGTREEEN